MPSKPISSVAFLLLVLACEELPPSYVYVGPEASTARFRDLATRYLLSVGSFRIVSDCGDQFYLVELMDARGLRDGDPVAGEAGTRFIAPLALLNGNDWLASETRFSVYYSVETLGLEQPGNCSDAFYFIAGVFDPGTDVYLSEDEVLDLLSQTAFDESLQAQPEFLRAE